MFGLSDEVSKRVEQRLREEQVIWLITARADGTPQPSPVWFLWDGDTVLIYSQPNTPKIRNIAQNPTVALHLNSNYEGGDIAIFTGTARSGGAAPSSDQVAAYIEKYRRGIANLGSTPEKFAHEYSETIFVTPTKLRAF